MTVDVTREPVTFLPEIEPEDALASYWLKQVTLRLRREITWMWEERELKPPTPQSLPPPVDRVSASLDFSRYRQAKRDFFATDVTASYLTERLGQPPPRSDEEPQQGSFRWVVDELKLDPAACFVFALALSVRSDHSAGSVIAACLNDNARNYPCLALAQRLWDDPAAILSLAHTSHPLFRLGLVVARTPSHDIDWEQSISIPVTVAQILLFPNPAIPQIFCQVARRGLHGEDRLSAEEKVAVSHLNAGEPTGLRVFPVTASAGSDAASLVARVVHAAARQVVTHRTPYQLGDGNLDEVATCCWLLQMDLLLQMDSPPHTSDGQASPMTMFPRPTIPLNLFVVGKTENDFQSISPALRATSLTVPQLTHAQRVAAWRRGLGTMSLQLGDVISECSRRYRLQELAIESICRRLCASPELVEAADISAACRAEIQVEMGVLAERIMPRFSRDELVLPRKQTLQLEAIRTAMQSLTDVHYRWGTARVWNEAGISVLFAGLPGTGKTMAAEVLAAELALPLYRVDLSQIVNKYVGETPKNLKRVFDAADVCDLILFFDEADALFGKRTDVKDAHDRFANTEVSYLLTRMENSKGLTILATNRREDLDQAFLRRLRYVVDFPKPDVVQRKAMWDKAIPRGVNGTEIDTAFLAKRFSFTGGHIRSAVFNACLQSAHSDTQGATGKPVLAMRDVVLAAWEEMEKQNHSMSPAQLGRFADVIENLLDSERHT